MYFSRLESLITLVFSPGAKPVGHVYLACNNKHSREGIDLKDKKREKERHEKTARETSRCKQREKERERGEKKKKRMWNKRREIICLKTPYHLITGLGKD